MADFNPITNFSTTLAQSMTSSQLTSVLSTVTVQGHAVVTADYGTAVYLTLNPGASNMEVAKATSNSGTTFTLTKRGLAWYGQGDSELSAYKFDHIAGEPVIVSNVKNFQDQYVTLVSDQSITGLKTFLNTNRPKLDSDVDAVANEEFVDFGQLSRAVFGTIVSPRVCVPGTAGETLVAGNLIYLKIADGRWWKTTAVTAATVENVELGIAQGAGVAAGSISAGVLRVGNDANQSGLTGGVVYYASDTAGAISATPGTVSKVIGYGSTSATTLYFDPLSIYVLTSNQQLALAGSSGTPSTTNKFVTANDLPRDYASIAYGASVVGTDAYAFTYTPAASLVTGTRLSFKADVANTGPATFSPNALTAKPIINPDGSALVTGQIVAGQVVIIQYESTADSWMLMSGKANVGNKIGTLLTAVTVASSTVETTLFTISIPANTLSTANAIHARVYFTGANATAGNQTFRWKYGGTTVLSIGVGGATFTGANGIMDFTLLANASVSAQIGQSYLSLPTSLTALRNNGAAGTAAENSATALNLVLTIENANSNAGDTITFLDGFVERIS